MISLIANSFGLLAVLPFFPFAAVFFLSSFWLEDKKKRLMLAMDVTTLFLIASVSGIFNVLFHFSFGLYGLIMFLLLAAGLLGNMKHRKHGKVNIRRLIRTIWRLSFFLLSIVYVLLLLIGIIVYWTHV
ncbi:DUF3397 family protein [Paenibacillus sp. UMB4589-SE434]|uniref:DUF3397 family protein n=1 Tax=Paenibacillus sp. UMB4589-SE434 TaxID=3046314 RepID=UPI00254F2714|nr:DUF3397 family protein [Paenibacillus sp. UMB4589-SE434]MDK8180953.1 DUF3397 family protein [Paenibacillus sp. UMB4589-SE434]